MNPRLHRFNLVLGLIVLAGLGLRLYWVIKVGHVPVSRSGDQQIYVEQAMHLRKPVRLLDYYYFYNTPGYPFFGGMLLRAGLKFGWDLPPRLIFGLVQAVLAATTIVLAAHLARLRLGSQAAGIVTAVILAFWVNQIAVVGLVVAENLADPMIMLLFYLVLARTGPPRWGLVLAAACGGLMGLIFLTKPIYWPIALVAIAILVQRSSSSSRRRKFLMAGVCLASIACLLVPWAAFVSRTTGHLSFSTAAGFNFCLGNNPHATGLWSDEAAEVDCFKGGGADPVVDARLGRKGLTWAWEHPGEQPRLIKKRWSVVWAYENGTFSSFYYPGLWKSWSMPWTPQRWSDLNFTEWTWIRSMALVGLVAMASGKLHRRFAIQMVAFGAAALVVTLASVADPRYREPLIPLMAICVAYLVAVLPLRVIDALKGLRRWSPASTPPYLHYRGLARPSWARWWSLVDCAALAGVWRARRAG